MKLPFKNILCPTDFSESSYEAIKVAGEITFHFGSELILLHVVSPVPLVPMGEEPSAFNVPLYEHELEASSKRTLREIINQLEWKELKVRLIVLRGNAADEIIRTAHEENVDLIVIATRGRTGLDRLIFGSVAEKVVRLAKCPVLTVASGPSKEEDEEKKGESAMQETEIISQEEKLEKKAYREKIEAQLKELGVKVDELKAKVEESRAALKKKYEGQIGDLKTKQEVLQKKLEELKESGEETWEQLKTGIEKSFDELKDSVNRTISTFKEKGEGVAETVSRKKKAYVQKVEAQLGEWGLQMDVLKAKAEKSKAEVKKKYLEQIQEFKSKQEIAKQRLHELRGSGDEAWGDFKEGVEDALEEMKKALRQAASRFKKR